MFFRALAGGILALALVEGIAIAQQPPPTPSQQVPPWPEKEMSFEDPRKPFPNWPQHIWQLIEDNKVAIGMTLDMARLACSGELKERGFVVTESEAGVIYYGRGCDEKFLVIGGKVTKYAE